MFWVLAIVGVLLTGVARGQGNYRLVVDGKIFPVPAVQEAGQDWLEAGKLGRVLAAMGAKADYEPGERLLVVSYPRSSVKPAMPVPRGTALTVVFNGHILKTASVQRGDGVYLSLEALAAITAALGRAATWDRTERVVTFAASAAGTSSPPPTHTSQVTPPSPPAGKGLAVAEYMNALKAVYDANKPTAAEKEKWRRVSIDPRSLKVDDIRAIRAKYQNVVDGTRRLAPPPAECAEIHTMTLATFGKMLRILDLSADMITTGSPANANLVQELVAEAQDEAWVFDRKVKAIRTRYNLGPP